LPLFALAYHIFISLFFVANLSHPVLSRELVVSRHFHLFEYFQRSEALDFVQLEGLEHFGYS
jgi:hypothetical protein